MAAVWQLTPSKARALRACHRTIPLAPRGWRADRDCFRYGWTIARSCLASCWGLMGLCVVAGHAVAPMACAIGVGVLERYSSRLGRRATSGLLGAFALCYVAALFLR